MGIIDRSQVKEIYGLLGDKLSKNIFSNRLMYSLTDDMWCIRNVICSIKKEKNFMRDWKPVRR